MKRIVLFATLAAAAMALACPVYAGADKKSDQDLERAQKAYKQAKRTARVIDKKRPFYKKRMKQLEGIIERLEDGQDVSTREIDRLMRVQ